MLGNRGDTLVEVMLAIAVVGAILAGAYVSSSGSLAGTRQSQERGEALQLVQSQLEYLKAASRNGNSPVYTMSNDFCFAGGSLNPQAAPCFEGPDSRYRLSITRNTAGDTHDFTASASWDPAGSGEQQNVDISYRVSQ